jgi:hypothetical protein
MTLCDLLLAESLRVRILIGTRIIFFDHRLSAPLIAFTDE